MMIIVIIILIIPSEIRFPLMINKWVNRWQRIKYHENNKIKDEQKFEVKDVKWSWSPSAQLSLCRCSPLIFLLKIIKLI